MKKKLLGLSVVIALTTLTSHALAQADERLVFSMENGLSCAGAEGCEPDCSGICIDGECHYGSGGADEIACCNPDLDSLCGIPQTDGTLAYVGTCISIPNPGHDGTVPVCVEEGSLLARTLLCAYHYGDRVADGTFPPEPLSAAMGVESGCFARGDTADATVQVVLFATGDCDGDMGACPNYLDDNLCEQVDTDCGGTPEPDAGPNVDAGMPVDAEVRDAEPPVDAADASMSMPDARVTQPDAMPEIDAGPGAGSPGPMLDVDRKLRGGGTCSVAYGRDRGTLCLALAALAIGLVRRRRARAR